MIKKAKLSVNEEYVRSSIAFLEMKRSCQEITDVRMCVEDTYLTDWRWLGFNEVDFGWGEPLIACPVIGSKFCYAQFYSCFPQRARAE
jgi:hypothetical protein